MHHCDDIARDAEQVAGAPRRALCVDGCAWATWLVQSKMTLLFAMNAKEIVNVVQVNQVMGKGALLEAYKLEVQELRTALANGGGT